MMKGLNLRKKVSPVAVQMMRGWGESPPLTLDSMQTMILLFMRIVYNRKYLNITHGKLLDCERKCYFIAVLSDNIFWTYSYLAQHVK